MQPVILWKTVIVDPKEMLGILDLQLVGYYKIKQGILQQNVSKYYRFESTNTLCEQLNTFIRTLKKKKDETKEKCPWLEPDNERRNMSEREILDKYVDIDKSCLTDAEKKQVMDILYKYKDAFSLRDEKGIAVTDKSPFFIRPYHVKEEDRNILDKEMKRV